MWYYFNSKNNNSPKHSIKLLFKTNTENLSIILDSIDKLDKIVFDLELVKIFDSLKYYPDLQLCLKSRIFFLKSKIKKIINTIKKPFKLQESLKIILGNAEQLFLNKNEKIIEIFSEIKDFIIQNNLEEKIKPAIIDEMNNIIFIYKKKLNKIVDILFENVDKKSFVTYFFQKIIISEHTSPQSLPKLINIILFQEKELEKTKVMPEIIKQLIDDLHQENCLNILNDITVLTSLETIWLNDYENLWHNLAHFLIKEEEKFDIYVVLFKWLELLKSVEIPAIQFQSKSKEINEIITEIISNQQPQD